MLRTAIVISGLVLVLFTAGGAACQKGWSLFEPASVCIKSFGLRKTWVDARRYCQELGGDLVQIRTEQMEGFVKAKRPHRSNSWIGVRDFDHDGNFEYVDTSKLFTSERGLRHWGITQPYKKQKENYCVALLSYSRGWRNLGCSRRLAFVCEKVFTIGGGKDPSPGVWHHTFFNELKKRSTREAIVDTASLNPGPEPSIAESSDIDIDDIVASNPFDESLKSGQ